MRRLNVDKAVSVFIMDVTASTEFSDGKELTEYLQNWGEMIRKLDSSIEL
jgi:hypothetical protein